MSDEAKAGWLIGAAVAVLGVGGAAYYVNQDNKQSQIKESTPSQNQTESTSSPPVQSAEPQQFQPRDTSSKPAVSSVDGVDYDCGDFGTHQEAQDYFESQGGSPSNNVDRLDRDSDGVACETLP